MKKNWFKGKRVTVFGIGLNRGALATIRFLAEAGVREIIATDIKSRDDLMPTIRQLERMKNITYILGQHRTEDFTHVDMVIKNPIIPWTNEYIKSALAHHVPVEMDASLFISLVSAPMIGVTGTKGKSTTASLIAHILEMAGWSINRAGINQIGFLDVVSQVKEGNTVIAELSSWRLSAFPAHHYSPETAIITNIYPDHLNYYKRMAPYVADKENIFRFQKTTDLLILNYDDEKTRAMADQAHGRVVWFSEKPLSEGVGYSLISGSVEKREQNGNITHLFTLPEMRLRGEHNQSNILAAIATVLEKGVSPEKVCRVLSSFSGLPHRLEFIGESEGVQYYNDTTATMPEAAIAGLRSFSQPIVLIAGGADKGFEYHSFAQALVSIPKSVILLAGTATDKLRPLLEKEAQLLGKEGNYPVVSNMLDALRLAADEADFGDVVLLSPGAASFGLFQNEFDRGEQFRSGVQEQLNHKNNSFDVFPVSDTIPHRGI